MKVRTLFNILLKAAGLVALWKFLTSLSGLVISAGVFSTIDTGIQGSGFFASLVLSTLLSTGISALVAFICLVRTATLVKMLNVDDEQTIDTDKKLMFDVLVIFAALLLIINGASDALHYDYKTNTDNQTATVNGATHSTVNVANTQTRQINYFAFLELVLGVMFIFRARTVSDWLMLRLDEGEEKPREWPDMYRQL